MCCLFSYSQQTHEVPPREVEAKTCMEKGCWFGYSPRPLSQGPGVGGLLDFSPLIPHTAQFSLLAVSPTRSSLSPSLTLYSLSPALFQQIIKFLLLKNTNIRSNSRQDFLGRRDSQNWAEDKCWVAGAKISESWRKSDVFVCQMEAWV